MIRDLPIRGFNKRQQAGNTEHLNVGGGVTPEWEGEKLVREECWKQTWLTASRWPQVSLSWLQEIPSPSPKNSLPPDAPLTAPQSFHFQEKELLSACFVRLSARPKQAHEGYKPAASLGLFISSRQILCQCSLQLGDILDNLTTPSDASRANFSSFRKGWANNGSI